MARATSRQVLIRLFFASTVGLVLLLAVTIWRQLHPAWGPYQVAYAKLLARTTGQRPPWFTPLEVKQIHLPQLGRTDRCTTCHLGVDNPKMADAPQPFRTHPDYLIHPVEAFGCTVCHGGQGMAVTKQDAHGFVKHWERPLLPKPLLAASCASCHEAQAHLTTPPAPLTLTPSPILSPPGGEERGEGVGLAGTERLVRGKQLFDRLGCIGCHAVRGWGGPISTDLATVAYKPLDEFDFRYVRGPHTAVAWNLEHFKEPQRVNPGDPANHVPPTPMPNYQFTEEEATDLTALVFSYWREEVPSKYRVAAAPLTPDPSPSLPLPSGERDGVRERGRAVFQKYGCVGCHGIEGRGGMKNYNASTGGEVPPLTYVAQGLTNDQLKALIREGRYPTKADPRGPTPPLWMPTWKDKLSPEELDDVVEYLVSLYPSEMTLAAGGS
ncbi:MAG: cytochrome c [Candidatus Omnitrophica bacterium]|nr:cytochrome c [Candidatus Omnitrophota bacterium]